MLEDVHDASLLRPTRAALAYTAVRSAATTQRVDSAQTTAGAPDRARSRCCAMTIAREIATSGPTFLFDRKALRALALAHRERYAAARPYPHVVIDGLLGDEIASALAERFPRPDHPGFVRRDYAEQSARLGQLQRSGFEGVDPAIRHLLAELSAMAFLDFVSMLTGIEGLIPDPHFRGAGISLTLPGGHLALHADFNRDRMRHLERKITVLYYLPRTWDPAWGGALELWDAARTRCEASHLPLRDRLIVMAHGDAYWHGHPAPLACPEGHFRASIAAYYYVAAPSPQDAEAHGAIW
jgi:Rps23 Pro-64 3,4-dihydroxylase Tpa1-like proline 4-hydroxylase